MFALDDELIDLLDLIDTGRLVKYPRTFDTVVK